MGLSNKWKKNLFTSFASISFILHSLGRSFFFLEVRSNEFEAPSTTKFTHFEGVFPFSQIFLFSFSASAAYRSPFPHSMTVFCSPRFCGIRQHRVHSSVSFICYSQLDELRSVNLLRNESVCDIERKIEVIFRLEQFPFQFHPLSPFCSVWRHFSFFVPCTFHSSGYINSIRWHFIDSYCVFLFFISYNTGWLVNRPSYFGKFSQLPPLFTIILHNKFTKM